MIFEKNRQKTENNSTQNEAIKEGNNYIAVSKNSTIRGLFASAKLSKNPIL
jgi:hypothetical protein